MPNLLPTKIIIVIFIIWYIAKINAFPNLMLAMTFSGHFRQLDMRNNILHHKVLSQQFSCP